MKQSLLRAKLRVKRELVHKMGYTPGNVISLNRAEAKSNVSYDLMDPYSKSIVLEIYDPRSQLIKGHYFQERNTFLVKNIILEPRLGLLYNFEGSLIEESTNWPIYQFYNSFPWNPKRQFKKVRISSAIFLPSSAFGHWLMEDLPLTIFALQANPNSPILVACNTPKYVSDFLKLLDRDVIYLDGPVQVDSLILVQKNLDIGWPHPKDLDILEGFKLSTLPIVHSIPSRKIYASRRGSKRSPLNEEEIELLFQSHGFEVFRMETLDILDEIRLMSETRVIAGVHGSSLANMAWMPLGGAMMDIVNENYWTEAGHRLAYVRESTYHPVVFRGSIDSKIDCKKINAEIDSMMDNFE